MNININKIHLCNKQIYSIESETADLFDNIKTDHIDLISLEDDEKRNINFVNKMCSAIVEFCDKIYQHIVSFIKAIVNFFKKFINWILGKDELKDVVLQENQDYITLYAKKGLKTIQKNIPLTEFKNITKLQDSNRKMVKCVETEYYISYVKKIVKEINIHVQTLETTNKIHEQTLTRLDQIIEDFEKQFFVEINSDTDYIKNVGKFALNLSNNCIGISNKIISITKDFENVPNKINSIKTKLQEKVNNITNPSSTDANELTNDIKNIQSFFNKFMKLDKFILDSSAGYTSVFSELYSLINREFFNNDKVHDFFQFFDRQINVVHNGSESFNIRLNKVTITKNDVSSEEFAYLCEICRKLNLQFNSNNSQVIKSDGSYNSINDEIVKFLSLIKSKSRKIQSVVGTDNLQQYIIYSFDCKIQQDKNGNDDTLIINGDILKDNKQKLDYIPNYVYHFTTKDLGENCKLYPTSGNYNQGIKWLGRYGLGYNQNRLYCGIEPTDPSGNLFKNTLNRLVLKLSELYESDNDIAVVYNRMCRAVLSNPSFFKMQNPHIYKIDTSKLDKNTIFVDQEHKGGRSAVNSKINAIYIETKDPIDATDDTDSFINKEMYTSKFSEIVDFIKDRNIISSCPFKFLFKL